MNQTRNLRMNGRTNDSDRRLGTTLVETSAVVSVLAVVLGTLGSALTTSQTAFTETVSSAAADDQARTTLQKLLDELRFADFDSVVLGASTDARSVRYQTIEGWDGDATTSAEKTLTFSNGAILLDGTRIADRVQDLRLNLVEEMLTVELDIVKTIVLQGESRVISRSLVADIRL